MNWPGFFDHIRLFIAHELAIYTWRDCAEILVIAITISFFTHWLAQDQSKKPILLFYSYCAATILCYAMHLSIAGTLLLACMPILLVGLIIVHQHSIQKNFIIPRTIDVSPTATSYAWVDELVRAALSALNKKHAVTYLIERHDHIAELISAPYRINADVQKNMLELLIAQTPETDTMLWIHQSGKIVATQAHLATEIDDAWLSSEANSLPLWKQDALFITQKSDALVVHFDPHTHLAECILQGKIVRELTAQHALLLIKRHLTTHFPEDTHYDKTKNTEQPLTH